MKTKCNGTDHSLGLGERWDSWDADQLGSGGSILRCKRAGRFDLRIIFIVSRGLIRRRSFSKSSALRPRLNPNEFPNSIND